MEVTKEWMHGCVMENVQRVKIELENIWIDLIRSIYAPYKLSIGRDVYSHMRPRLTGLGQIKDNMCRKRWMNQYQTGQGFSQ